MSQPSHLLPPLTRPASRFEEREVAWLWPGRIALGKLSVLEGDPGLGKSMLTLDLCARLTTGRPMPDGSHGPGPCHVIVLNAEDNAEDTIVPRLRALDADLDRVLLPHFPDGEEYGFALPSQLARLRADVEQYHAKLVIIDPITAFLDEHIFLGSDQSIRRFLSPLAQLAMQTQAAILLIRHLCKLLHRFALYRGAGTIGIAAACRSAWLVADDPTGERKPDDPACGLAPAPTTPRRCVLAQVKNNLAPPQPSLAYEFRPAAIPTLDWCGPSPLRAQDLLAGAVARPVGHGGRIDQARILLKEFLENGPRTSHEIWPWARDLGLSVGTINRAKKELGIQTKLICEGPTRRYYWFLKGHQLPGAPDMQDDPVERRLQELCEQYPVPTPLDDL